MKSPSSEAPRHEESLGRPSTVAVATLPQPVRPTQERAHDPDEKGRGENDEDGGDQRREVERRRRGGLREDALEGLHQRVVAA